MSAPGKLGISDRIRNFDSAISSLEQKVAGGKFSPISPEYQELVDLSLKINDLAKTAPERFQLGFNGLPGLIQLQNRIQVLQGKVNPAISNPKPIQHEPIEKKIAALSKEMDELEKPGVKLDPKKIGSISDRLRDVKRNYIKQSAQCKPLEDRLVKLNKKLGKQTKTTYQPDPANFSFASMNQYDGSVPSSRSSCTSNALSFLSFAMTQTGQNIKANLPTKKVDDIVKKGIEKFQEKTQLTKSELTKDYNETLKNWGKAAADQFLVEQKGTVMSPVDLVEAYPGSFGKPPYSPKTQNLPRDFHARTHFFMVQLSTLETHLTKHGAVGTTLTANGKTSSLALVKNHEGKIEYCFFDSHGESELNRNRNAFVYVTTDKEEAACYLSSFIKYINPLESETIEGIQLTDEERSIILADLEKQEGMNQLALSIQVPPRKIHLDAPPPDAAGAIIAPANTTEQTKQEGWSSSLISAICAIAYAIIFFPVILWNYFKQESPKVTPPQPPKVDNTPQPKPKPPKKPVKRTVPVPSTQREKGEAIFIDFYLGNKASLRADPMQQGFTFEQILSFTDAEMEEHHDFIQWLFPLVNPSGANPSAPTATDQIIIDFRENPELQTRLLLSFEKMLDYYGLELNSSDKVIRSQNFDRKKNNWLINHGHNLLRMSRIIGSLAALGRPDLAQSFYEVLESVYLENKSIPQASLSDSMKIWANTIRSYIPGYRTKV